MSDAADEVKDLIEKSRRLLDQANEFAARYEQLTSELREILAKLERERKKI
jgi:ABC-type transporter Mla subunit MlaD